MKSRHYFSLAIISLVLLAASAAPLRAQDEPQEEEGTGTRGAFLATRPTTSATPRTNNPPSGRSNNAGTNRPSGNSSSGDGATNSAKNTGPKPASSSSKGSKKNSSESVANNTSKNSKKGTGKGGVQQVALNNNATAGGSQGTTFAPANFSAGAIGLGYTLYMRDASGDATRTDPSRVFRDGEAIRLVLEANTDGYLYIFHTENAKNPQMIFPDARLGRGTNFIRAHVPYEVPSNMETDERLRWFVFDPPSAMERLYIVVTREPLSNIPVGDALVKYCQNENNSCPWSPTPGIWAQLQSANDKEEVAVSRIKDEGRPQTSGEREAATRGLGLSPDAPGPSIIRMTASSTTGVLLTMIDLVHK